MSTLSKDCTLKTVPANADLSTKQYYCMKLSAGKAVICDAAGESVFGILQNAPAAANRAAELAVSGVAKAIAGAAISQGAYVATDAAGKLKTAVAGKTDTSDGGVAADPLIGSHVIGKALSAAGADGDIIEVLLTNTGAVPTTAA